MLPRRDGRGPGGRRRAGDRRTRRLPPPLRAPPRLERRHAAGPPRSSAGWPARAWAPTGEWYAGRPLLVTENDYGLGLYNGDTGVVVAGEDGRLSAMFERGEFSPTRVGAVESVYAMTVHKSQGSQFGTAAVVLPGRRLADPHPRTALHGGHARA